MFPLRIKNHSYLLMALTVKQHFIASPSYALKYISPNYTVAREKELNQYLKELASNRCEIPKELISLEMSVVEKSLSFRDSFFFIHPYTYSELDHSLLLKRMTQVRRCTEDFRILRDIYLCSRVRGIIRANREHKVNERALREFLMMKNQLWMSHNSSTPIYNDKRNLYFNIADDYFPLT